MWAFCNGVAHGEPGQGRHRARLGRHADGGRQRRGGAPCRSASSSNVKVLVDDNNVTIAGHPQEYMVGYDLDAHARRLRPADRDRPWARTSTRCSWRWRARCRRPAARASLINKRKMAPGIEGRRGQPARATRCSRSEVAIKYLEERGRVEAADDLVGTPSPARARSTYRAAHGVGKNRDDFGKIINEILGRHDARAAPGQRARVRQRPRRLVRPAPHPQEASPRSSSRAASWSAATSPPPPASARPRASRASSRTFSAFLEMCVSEITMARLNFANVLAHFSHSGVDDMADNTCHFGINIDVRRRRRDARPRRRHDAPLLPGRPAPVRRVREDASSTIQGLRFVFSTRAPVPDILDDDGKPMFARARRSTPGKDDIIREGKAATSSRSAS